MGTLQFFGSLLIFSLLYYSYACGYYYEEVTLDFFQPSSDCPPPPEDPKGLQVVNTHGPCLPKEAQTSVSPLILWPKIHSNIRTGICLASQSLDFLSVKSGKHLESTSFVVTVGWGSEGKGVSLIIDTGSDLTWTQCLPCETSCYNQKDPIFNPTKSESYSNIPLDSSTCNELLASSTTEDSPQHFSSTSQCVYSITYADNSYSGGYFATEMITLTADQVPKKLTVGCGQNNVGSYGQAAGVLGLGRGPISVVSETAQSFSYCLPSESSASGYLSFGNSGVPNTVKFTPFEKRSEGPLVYFITLKGIRLGRKLLPIREEVFSRTGTIIDSGTVITRLPKQAYAELRDAFRSILKDHPLADPFYDFLDTCYEFHDRSRVPVPPIEFIFAQDAVLEVEKRRIYYPVSRTKLCLAFAESKDANTPGILGSYQQVTQHIVYDVAGGRLGIGKGGCQ